MSVAPTSSSMFKCEECSSDFTMRKNLYAHMRKVHYVNNLVVTNRGKGSELCSLCGIVFTRNDSLRRHERKVHGMEVNESTRKSRIKCPQCDLCVASYNSLRKHMEVVHDIQFHCEEMEFDNIAGFEEWKASYEQQNNVCYVMNCSKQHLKEGCARYYHCHRTFEFSTRGTGARSLKSMGSNKIGSACPSTMQLVTMPGKCSVKFYPNHVGHTADIGRTFLNKNVRTVLAGRLSEGVPVGRVLTDIRSAPATGVQRMHLLEKKDLHNIKRDFNIGYATKKHTNDAVSVQLWVDEMKTQPDNPVLFYKPQNHSHPNFKDEDFVLIFMTGFQTDQLLKYGEDKICVDGTHGLTAYDFQLFTLMVVDKYGCGIPAAFCFSNRGDQCLLSFYFEQIKQKVGTVKTNVFMSDDAPAFYNAWVAVMGQVPHQLLCSWHVLKNWAQNLTKISGGSAKQKVVFENLKELQKELNVDAFREKLDNVLKDLSSDQDSKEFGKYFLKMYCQRVEKWAYCFRHGLGLNTNNHLESLHKLIKHNYLDGKKCKRLDKSINALLCLVRDKVYDGLIKFTKNKQCARSSRIKASHGKSSEIKREMISACGEGLWEVCSSNHSDVYIVSKNAEQCTRKCAVICNVCRICIHSYKCTCLDNIMNVNICKHIHACVKYVSGTQQVSEPCPLPSTAGSEYVAAIESGSLEKSAATFKEEVTSHCETLIGLSRKSNCNQDVKNKVLKGLKQLVGVLNEGIFFSPEFDVNTNAKIDIQAAFFSTKKKK